MVRRLDHSLISNKVKLRALRELSGFKSQKLLVAVSGGLDSMVLLEVLRSLKNLNLTLIVAHIHHGLDSKGFRNQAYAFVKKYCDDHHLQFVSNLKGQLVEPLQLDDLGFEFPGNDESSLRRFRMKSLKKLQSLTAAQGIVFAHHRDDLLETRLIRLIRGVGAQGLQAMSKVTDQKILRPFLTLSRKQIESIGLELRVSFIEDPSNLDLHYLRNWIRYNWLPQLEAYRPGAKQSLSRSLENLLSLLKTSLPRLQSLIGKEGIDRTGLLALDLVEQRQVIASYLRLKHVKNYSASQIDEVLKRLKSSRKELQFRVSGRVWHVGEHIIRIHPL